MSIPTISILDVKISLVTNETVLSAIEQLLQTKNQIQIVTPNPEHVMIAQRNPEFLKVLNEADLAVPDGTGVVWAARKNIEYRIKNLAKKTPNPKLDSGFNIPNSKVDRVTGVDLMSKLCQWAAEQNQISNTKYQKKAKSTVINRSPFTKGERREAAVRVNSAWKVGLMGGGDRVAELAAQNLRHQFPDLDIVTLPSHKDIKHPEPREDRRIIQAIQDNKINVLFVAYGAPYQELWIARLLNHQPSVINHSPLIAMGVGGALDIYAGKLKRPPVWLQQLHLEWLFRLLQQPWRWRRQLTWMEFAWKTLVLSW